MKYSPLANTDLKVSVIGLGTVKFGRNQQVKYPASFSLPTDKEINNLLSCAKELGINFLDTAPAYGSSEERLGKLLKNQRHDWCIATKVGEEFIDGQSHYDFSENAVRKSIERSLVRLNTDYLDIVFIHSNGDDNKIITSTNIFSVLNDFKAAGKLRAIGMSTKTVTGGLQALEHADAVMVAHNPVYTEEKSVIDAAYQQKKSVFIKKALASGHLNQIANENPVEQAMNFILKENGITSIVLGTLNPEHLKHNVVCANKALGI